MDQDLDGDFADGVERAEDVESWCGTETEDGLPFVQDYEGLQERQRGRNTFIVQHFCPTAEKKKSWSRAGVTESDSCGRSASYMVGAAVVLLKQQLHESLRTSYST